MPVVFPYPLEVDKPSLHISADQLHPDPAADVHAFKTLFQLSFDGRIQDADPCPCIRGAGDECIELLPDP